MPTWEGVVAIGTQLPGVEVGTSFRTPALRVRGKGMCRLRTNPAALVLRVADMGEREALLQGQPEVFSTTPHYDGYPYVQFNDALQVADSEDEAHLVLRAHLERSMARPTLTGSHDQHQPTQERQPHRG